MADLSVTYASNQNKKYIDLQNCKIQEMFILNTIKHFWYLKLTFCD